MKLTPEEVAAKRRQREVLFKMIFIAQHGVEIDETQLDMIVDEINERKQQSILLSQEDRINITKRAKEILTTEKELDEIISSHIKGWKIERLSAVDLCILRIAVFELLYDKEMPQSVVINEAVVLAGIFDEEKSKAFVNGVLSSINKQINNEE